MPSSPFVTGATIAFVGIPLLLAGFLATHMSSFSRSAVVGIVPIRVEVKALADTKLSISHARMQLAPSNVPNAPDARPPGGPSLGVNYSHQCMATALNAAAPVAHALTSHRGFGQLQANMSRGRDKHLQRQLETLAATGGLIPNALHQPEQLCNIADLVARRGTLGPVPRDVDQYQHADGNINDNNKAPASRAMLEAAPPCNVSRIVIFGGSMTWGVDAAKPWTLNGARILCPGCPAEPDNTVTAPSHPADAASPPPAPQSQQQPPPPPRAFSNQAHCCSWPSILSRFLREAGLEKEVPVYNLAVPATSMAWLADQVTELSSSLPGGSLNACDVALLDYSVNDANGQQLFDNDEGKLTSAVVAVYDKLWSVLSKIINKTKPESTAMDEPDDTDHNHNHDYDWGVLGRVHFCAERAKSGHHHHHGRC